MSYLNELACGLFDKKITPSMRKRLRALSTTLISDQKLQLSTDQKDLLDMLKLSFFDKVDQITTVQWYRKLSKFSKSGNYAGITVHLSNLYFDRHAIPDKELCRYAVNISIDRLQFIPKSYYYDSRFLDVIVSIWSTRDPSSLRYLHLIPTGAREEKFYKHLIGKMMYNKTLSPDIARLVLQYGYIYEKDVMTLSGDLYRFLLRHRPDVYHFSLKMNDKYATDYITKQVMLWYTKKYGLNYDPIDYIPKRLMTKKMIQFIIYHYRDTPESAAFRRWNEAREYSFGLAVFSNAKKYQACRKQYPYDKKYYPSWAYHVMNNANWDKPIYELLWHDRDRIHPVRIKFNKK
jgi:hypothetical protein